ncbi:GNAT family N-acetyltransferase [Streptomyces sp. NPDC020794]|uniref:GNAT family N-acetyltransferase n=1 Tax=unclassified Streptomyces TaxID=2593676 RepID=UPI0036E4F09B
MNEAEAASKVTVADAPENSRYEARITGTLVGFADYRRTAHAVVFVHTEVQDAYRGRGIASALGRYALDDARAAGLRVVATCPFIAWYIDQHPEYHELRREPAQQ